MLHKLANTSREQPHRLCPALSPRRGKPPTLKHALLRAVSLAAFSCVAASLGWSQAASGSQAQGVSKANQLPLSGRTGDQAGTVTSQQQTSGGNDADAVSTKVNVSGPLMGSVPDRTVVGGPLHLSMAEAIRRGLRNNLGKLSSDLSVSAADAQHRQVRSALLPQIAGTVAENETQINLAVYGLTTGQGGLPSLIGPFSYFQAQATLNAPLFDLVQINNLRANRASTSATSLNARNVRETVVLAIAGIYLQTVAAQARLDSQQAQVDYAEAVYEQAEVRGEAGTTSPLDVNRSLVQYGSQQERLLSQKGELRKQKLALARLVGLPLDTQLILDPLRNDDEAGPVDQAGALHRAFEGRLDLQASRTQVQAAERALSAAHAQRIPSITTNGYYGVIGPSPTKNHGAFAAAVTLNLPFYDGGRTGGDIEQAETTLRQRKAELADQEGQIEQEVRTALIDLETASGQIKLARGNREYAHKNLDQTRDRFLAGITTSVEVIQAQQDVSAAESTYISSTFSLNLATLSLARAQGVAEAAAPQIANGRP